MPSNILFPDLGFKIADTPLPLHEILPSNLYIFETELLETTFIRNLSDFLLKVKITDVHIFIFFFTMVKAPIRLSFKSKDI